MRDKYPDLRNVFITGDFNTSDQDDIFNNLLYEGKAIKSLRYILPEDKSDFGATFNGFTSYIKYLDKAMKFCNLDPGATIDHIFSYS